MALYFYFNETTGDLVYSDKATYSGSGYTSLGQQTNTAPSEEADWVFNSKRANIKTVTKDPAVIVSIDILTSMNCMFSECQSATSIDLSGFDTSKVTNMNTMFDSCYLLPSIDLSGFDTSKVTNMGNMFYRCSSLTSLDLSGFDTSNVTNMNFMFTYCKSLVSLDLSGFDTSNVTTIESIFYGATNIRIIDTSPNMSNILPELFPTSYYDIADRKMYHTANIPGGSTYVRDLADIDLVATMVQARQGLRSLRAIDRRTRQMLAKVASRL